MKICSVISFLLFYFLLPFTSVSQEPKLILPIGHTLGVSYSDFSPDGKRIVSASLDNTVKIWEVASGKLLANLSGHTDTVLTARYSPDGRLIVTACEDGTAKIWDGVSTKLLSNIKGHGGILTDAKFSPDGKKIFTTSEDATAKIWDVASGKLLADLRGHTKAIWNAFFSSDGKKIVTTCDDHTAKIWEVVTGNMLLDLRGHTLEVWDAQFSYDGKKVITGSGDSSAKIWNAETGALLVNLKGHKSGIRFTSFSPDGKRILTGSDDGTAKIWSAETGVLLFELLGKNKENDIKSGIQYFNAAHAANFTPDGKKIITVYFDSTIKIWDAITGKLVREIKKRILPYNSVTLSSDCRNILFSLWSGKIEIWDIVTGNLLTELQGTTNSIETFKYSSNGKSILIGNRLYGSSKIMDAVTGIPVVNLPANKISGGRNLVRFSPDGKKILLAAVNKTPIVYDVETWKPLFNLVGHKKNLVPFNSHFSADGKKIFTSAQDSTAKIWDASTGKLLFDLKGKSPLSNIVIISSPDGKKLITTSRDSTAKIWDTETGTLLSDINLADNRMMTAFFSPDGDMVVLNIIDKKTSLGKIKIIETKTGNQFAELKDDLFYLSGIQFSPDGRKLFISLNDGTIRIWDIVTGTFLTNLTGHTTTVNILIFSPDGKKILSASEDGIAKLWNAETGVFLSNLDDHTLRIWSANFSPDGKKITTTSRDNTSKVWNAETGICLYTYISLNDDDYLVFDKNNRFDGSEAARKQLYFTCGTEVIELEQLKDQLWVPNLAERILNDEAINAAKLSDLNICNLTPVVDTIGQTASHYRFHITPRLGGLGATIVYVNGIEVKRYTPQQLQQQQNDYLLSVDKKELQKFFVPNKENNVMVKSLTAKNSISSRSVSINEKGVEKNIALPNLYAVVVGVSDYKGEGLDLKFAAKDAVDMANTIDASAKKLLNTDGKEHVFIHKVHTAAGRDKFPEKNSIRQVFTEIGTKAQPNDILLIFFAGHGVLESEKNQFYFLTADASNLTVSGALKNVGISTEELAEWIKPQVMKAQKRILIFDACNSGQAIKEIIAFNQTGQNLIAARSDDKEKQTKAIEKLNERSGMFILSASASDQKAYEMGKYNQGVLTYSLLRAIKEQPDILEDRRYLNISRWFNAAEKSVNELARETGARQQPQLVSTTNFNIGVVDEEVRNNIVLPFEKPMFTRSDFRNTEATIDNLKLRSLVDKELIDLSDEAVASIMYSTDYEGQNIYQLSGSYTVKGNDIVVSIIITQGGTEIKIKFEVKGMVDQLSSLAKTISVKVLEWLSKK